MVWISMRYAENNTENTSNEATPLILEPVSFRLFCRFLNLFTWHWWYLIHRKIFYEFKHNETKTPRTECSPYAQYSFDMHSMREKLRIQSTCRFLEFITRQNQINCVFSLVKTENFSFCQFIFTAHIVLCDDCEYENCVGGNSICSSVCLPSNYWLVRLFKTKVFICSFWPILRSEGGFEVHMKRFSHPQSIHVRLMSINEICSHFFQKMSHNALLPNRMNSTSS